MTFHVETVNYKIIKEAFESITRIVDEIVLTCDSEGIHLRSLDRSHITFITLELNKTLFDSYQCDTPEKIFLDAGEFMKILKKIKPKDTLLLDIDESSLLLTMNGDATRKFKIQFIDMEYDNPVPPQMNIPNNVRLPSSLLKEYVDNMADFSERLTFRLDQDYFKIFSSGQMGDAEIDYLHGENIREVVQSHFSVPKLQDILKASKFSEECELSIGEDMPLVLRMELITGDGYIEFLLAPRLEEDE